MMRIGRVLLHPELDENAQFSDRLRYMMLLRNLTQRELAERTGCTQTAICRLCNDANGPSVQILVEIARALDVSTDWLLGLTDKVGDTSSGPADHLPLEGKA